MSRDETSVRCAACGLPGDWHGQGHDGDACDSFTWPATHSPCSGCHRHTLTTSMPQGRCAACDATFEAGVEAGIVKGLTRGAVHLESLARSQELAAWESAQKGLADFAAKHESTAKAYRAGAESLREQAKWAGEKR